MSFHITFHKMSIRNQMKTIVILMLALFVLVCALISVSIRALIRRSEDEHMQVATQRLIDQMDLMYGKMENFCINIGEDDAIQALLASDYAQMSPLRRAAMECLARHKVLEPTIEDISLVNDKIHYSNVLRGEDLDRIRAMVNGRPFRWIGFCSHSFTSEAEKPDMMVYAGDVIVGTQNLGTIVISLNAADFLAENDGEENQMYFLTDREGVLFSIGQSAEEVYEVYRLWQEGDYPEHLAEGGHYDIRSYYFEDMDCYLVGALDVRDMGRGMTQIQLLIWGCVMAAGVFCALFFLLVSRGVVRPLHQFHATIRQIRQSSQRGLETDLNLRGCSEIEELGHEFSGMLEDIESLNRKIFQSATDLYELKVQKQEAELAYLRSQVDPHFLYNTLEVIRKMALEKDAPEIAQMTLDMGHIFRYSAKGEDEVTLEEEISIIKSYSRIQQMRFEGKISVYYFVSEDVLELKVMKMLLQPIVENSIFHGLEPKSGKGSLYIGARVEENDLIITVKDDGVGIGEAELAELQGMLREKSADTRKHVGTLNTNARIRLQYGERYGVQIESLPEDGTTVTLRLPAKE